MNIFYETLFTYGLTRVIVCLAHPQRQDSRDLLFLFMFPLVLICRYGNCFKTKLFGETHVFISSKDSAKTILRNEGGKFSKKYIKSISKLLGPDSLLCAAEQHHKLIRSRLFSLFSPHSLSSFVQLFDQLVVEATSTWTCGSLLIIQDEALKV